MLVGPPVLIHAQIVEMLATMYRMNNAAPHAYCTIDQGTIEIQ